MHGVVTKGAALGILLLLAFPSRGAIAMNPTVWLLESAIRRLPVWAEWWRPLPPAPLPARIPTAGVVTSRFGPRRHPLWGHRQWHQGIDIAEHVMALVRATQSGIVTRAGWLRGYGVLVEIDHGLGWRSRYAHLAACFPRVGDAVEPGAPIGRIGATGLATGPHLHFELRYRGQSVDPLPYLLALTSE